MGKLLMIIGDHASVVVFGAGIQRTQRAWPQRYFLVVSNFPDAFFVTSVEYGFPQAAVGNQSCFHLHVAHFRSWCLLT